MPFKPKQIINQLSIELLVLEQELLATGLVGKIDSSTLLVYSALKSGITDTKEIAKCFFLSEPTVEKQYNRLAHIRCRILKIRRTNKSKFTRPEIDIIIQMIPDMLQQQIIEITETIDIPQAQHIPIIVKPLSKKDRLKRLQM